MLKFFRRIRKNLIEEKKVKNYLLYAIGEIVLVVIGILIALAINNAQLRSTKKDKEQVYLSGLHEEFETSLRKLEVLRDVNNQNLEGSKQLLSFIESDSLEISEQELSNILIKTFAFDIAYNPNKSLLEEMISSGSLKDLSNTKLRIQLTNWISTLEDIAKQEEELRIQRQFVTDMMRRDSLSVRTIFDDSGISNDLGIPLAIKPISNRALLSSPEFENNVLLFLITANATEQMHYIPLYSDLKNIVASLEAELEY
ncbi:DUF6090 family protein [Luteirhabdus pelagi]|uniref:DUF6090 family protein n=1 Tax=Luteirhabdus pelagi TaxID=2792783 RepID=UPI00193ADC60|nr:DUF6090 family protein [Luteirhabdus pelagi]